MSKINLNVDMDKNSAKYKLIEKYVAKFRHIIFDKQFNPTDACTILSLLVVSTSMINIDPKSVIDDIIIKLNEIAYSETYNEAVTQFRQQYDEVLKKTKEPHGQVNL